jgi:uroporphyrinogen decarboxylase
MEVILMKKNERIAAALKGETADRSPVGFWRHWPGDDQQANTLADAALNFQKRWDLDFIKLPVSSTYSVSDWGVKHEYQGSPNGDRAYLERAVRNPKDWSKIKPLDIEKGTYGRTLKALRSVLKQRDKDTPVIVTMFNPLSVAFYLAGDETCLIHMRTEAKILATALEAIIETEVGFAKEAISSGADGIFFSAKQACFEDMSENEYLRFGKPGDLKVLKAASKGWFNVLHLHGRHPMLSQLADYPAQALNWHDRTTSSLSEVGKLFKGGLMGGVEQYKVLHFGKPADVEAQVADAMRQMKGKRLIVSPGCTYPVTVPQMNLAALRQAVDKKGPNYLT